MTLDMEHERKRLEHKLVSLRKKGLLPESLLRIVSDTATLQLAARGEIRIELPPLTTAPDAHAMGVPLLPRDHFVFDPKQTAILFGKLMALMERAGGGVSDAARSIRTELENRTFRLAEACQAFLHDDTLFFADWSARLPQAPSLVRFLVQGSITPSLEAVAEQLHAAHTAEHPWRFGHCPYCGSLPLMSTDRGEDSIRHLSCSFCRAEYKATAEQCVYCGEEAPEKLELFSTDSEPGFTIHACRTCNCYLKTTNEHLMEGTSIPALDDLESLPLDVLARGQGLSRPALSAWGF